MGVLGCGDRPRDLLRDWEREGAAERVDFVRDLDRESERDFLVGERDLERDRGSFAGMGFVAEMVVETVPYGEGDFLDMPLFLRITPVAVVGSVGVELLAWDWLMRRDFSF